VGAKLKKRKKKESGKEVDRKGKSRGKKLFREGGERSSGQFFNTKYRKKGGHKQRKAGLK